ncbi:OmpA family protein [Mucilaginibacter lacusdianchii]|uniref:OmpA family protein n=1 Tax=Mucilaginibacter lacusdianchii TaxID=2684211 RepID=UPI00131D543F|nr:OmpA family protein [Mucilaginibacter sp. JXJ CY 39]
MNYSTLKKTVALSFASLMAVGAAKAQTSTTTTTSTTDSTASRSIGTAKVFGGRGQYKTFSLGINAGVLSPVVAIGGVHDYTDQNIELGYGVSARWQLAHSFGLQLDGHGGSVSGDNFSATNRYRDGMQDYDTRIWSATLSGVVNVATIDFIRRKNSVNFFVTGGAGMVWYHPTYHTANGAFGEYLNADGDKHYVKSLVIPVGAGVKFRLSDAVALNLGYTMNFTDDDNLDALKRGYPSRDKYSYGYGGLEFTLGGAGKPNLDWVNPVAMMYDELYDAALRQEVEALKGRVTNVENAVNDLKKDSDGDGVSDQFDKCPNTPAGTVVDGAGCPIKFPDTVATTGGAAAYSNIQFDFDSSVLRTSSYSVLDAVSADMRSNTSKTVTLNGYASSEGTAAHNMRLSKDRANSVKTYLVNSGVEARRVKVKGLGETNPIADNSTEEGRVQNRRVEFQQK